MKKFTEEAIEDLEIMYCTIKNYADNSDFLFGIELADNMEIDRLIDAFKENNLIVSIDKKHINIPASEFNTKEDLQKLVNCIRLCVSF
jgi:hypothetical protein